MKPTMTVLVCLLAASLASAQSPSIIQNTRTTMNSISSQQTAATNEALRQSAPDAVINTHVSAKASPVTKAGPITVTTPVKSGSGKSDSGKSKVAVVGVGVKRGAHAKAAVATKVMATKATAPKTEAAATAPVAVNVATAGAAPADSGDSKPALDSKYNANGRRDPFISPVVSHANGSGCSTGKKCLEIGAINLRGVVHSENGFIAVVSNDLNKAYFLRENDPVFNGYVVKITGDSIVFQETLQDRLGKTFTREVVKKITTPAV
jgi:hypothetical protein